MMKPVKHPKDVLKKKNSENFYMPEHHVLNVNRIKSVLQAERLSMIEG